MARSLEGVMLNAKLTRERASRHYRGLRDMGHSPNAIHAWLNDQAVTTPSYVNVGVLKADKPGVQLLIDRERI